MWHNFFDSIQVINLEKRHDRLIEVCGEMIKYDIPFDIKNAVERTNGAEGLLHTMIEIFNKAVSLNHDNILVFEDDAMWVEGVDVNEVMNKVVDQLPKDYLICYLGCQPSRGYANFYSPNLLPVTGAYSTHAWAISKRGIELILASNFDAPIDNHIVNHIQPIGGCYQVHPFLCTQRPGVSDIGGTFIDWSAFLEKRHEQKILELQCKK